jgi:hypothetical protein
MERARSSGFLADEITPDNEKPPTEVDGRERTPGGGARYGMTMTEAVTKMARGNVAHMDR